jgi:uncharacterized protein with von Willebrand factor type A (vWA) domain
MRSVLVVDRSLALPDNTQELYEQRESLVACVRSQLGSELRTHIVYSEVARVRTIEDVDEVGPDFVYGSNLQHALLLARVACRATARDRIVLVTYSLPSAHHVQGESFLMYPPIAESLEAARREAQSCVLDDIRIHVALIIDDPAFDRNVALQTFFRPIAEAAGGRLVSVQSGDQIEAVVATFLRG